MLTWKLWHTLNHPPTAHPLFWRTLYNTTTYASGTHLSRLDKLSIGYLCLFTGLIFLSNHIPQGLQSTLITLLLVFLAIPIIVPVMFLLRNTILSGTFHGLRWALSINRLIARERTNCTYELLSLLPTGILPSLWALSMGCLYSNNRFNRVVDLHITVLRFIIMLGFIVLFTLSMQETISHIRVIALFIIHVAALIALLHIEFVQSLVISVLLGMVIPLHTISPLDARIWTIGSFLFIQANTYTLTCIFSLLIVPAVFHRLDISGWPLYLAQIISALAVIYVLRELISTLLWHWLLHLTSVYSTESEDIFR